MQNDYIYRMKQFGIIFLTVLLLSCNQSKQNSDVSQVYQNQDKELEVYDFEGLKPFLNKADDKVHVVNFWATWCAPCIKELPYFEKLNAQYENENVEVLLVSFRFS